MEPRWIPDVPAAGDLDRTAAHEVEAALSGRIPFGGSFDGAVHLRGGWGWRQWHAWESRPGGLRAEYTLDVHGVSLSAVLRVRLVARFGIELEGQGEAVLGGAHPGFGGGRLEFAARFRPKGGNRLLVRIGLYGEARSVVVIRRTQHGVHAARLERIAVGLRVGLGVASPGW
jgi:hypothetical protein